MKSLISLLIGCVLSTSASADGWYVKDGTAYLDEQDSPISLFADKESGGLWVPATWECAQNKSTRFDPKPTPSMRINGVDVQVDRSCMGRGLMVVPRTEKGLAYIGKLINTQQNIVWEFGDKLTLNFKNTGWKEAYERLEEYNKGI